jgi:integrase
MQEMEIFKNNTEIRYFYEFKKMKNNFEKENKKINSENLENYCKYELKNRKEISNLKNAIKILIDRKVVKDEGFINILEKYQGKKPKHAREPEELFKFQNKLNAIDRLKNKRLKLAYRLQIVSGLRVEELSELKRSDIKVNEDNNLIIHVRKGKGNKSRVIQCLKDDFLLKELKDMQERKGKLFYSKSHLMNNARKLGFHTHDFRKCTAHIIFYNTVEDSIELVQKQLGHELGTKTYLKYIGREINFRGTKYNNSKRMLNELSSFGEL